MALTKVGNYRLDLKTVSVFFREHRLTDVVVYMDGDKADGFYVQGANSRQLRQMIDQHHPSMSCFRMRSSDLGMVTIVGKKVTALSYRGATVFTTSINVVPLRFCADKRYRLKTIQAHGGLQQPIFLTDAASPNEIIINATQITAVSRFSDNGYTMVTTRYDTEPTLMVIESVDDVVKMIKIARGQQGN